MEEIDVFKINDDDDDDDDDDSNVLIQFRFEKRRYELVCLLSTDKH